MNEDTNFIPQIRQQGALVRMTADGPTDEEGGGYLARRLPDGWGWASGSSNDYTMQCICKPDEVEPRLASMAVMRTEWEALCAKAEEVVNAHALHQAG